MISSQNIRKKPKILERVGKVINAIMNIMKKKNYQEPKIKIMLLITEQKFLTGSLTAIRDDYGIPTIQGWVDEDE